MSSVLTKILGIHNAILNLDRQADECLKMVCGLWALLEISTSCAAGMSMIYILKGYKDCMIYPIAMVGLSVVAMVLYVSYRRIICMTLFEPNWVWLRVVGYEILICIVVTFSWVPIMIRFLLNDSILEFSILDSMKIQRDGVSFMLLCLFMLLTVNFISALALYISSKRHRRISIAVYSS